jgi:hypothetical protein
MSALKEAARGSPLVRKLIALAGHVVRRRNHVVFELDLTVPREPTPWAPGERAVEIGPDNIDTVMTPELIEFMGGERVRKSLDGVRRGNRVVLVVDAEGYAGYGHLVINSKEYVRALGEREAVPYVGNFFTAPRARRRGLFEKINNECFIVLQRLGYRRVVAEARPTNAGSVKGSERVGMNIARHLTGWIVFEHVLIQRDGLTRGPWQILLR